MNRVYLSTRTGRRYLVTGKPGEPIPDIAKWLDGPYHFDDKLSVMPIKGTRQAGQLKLIGVNLKVKSK